MKFGIYKALEVSDDSLLLLEQNVENPFLSRIYSVSVTFEDLNVGVYNTRNQLGFNKIGGSSPENDWESLSFEQFVHRRKLVGGELQDRIDELFNMIKVEKFKCYIGSNFIIHVPRYKFRIAGPTTKYTFSNDSKENYESYFLKVTDNDWRLEEVIASGYSEISERNFDIIFETWSAFLALLMTDSRYA